MFSISAEWEALAEGTPEERACFASISVRFGEVCLSEGHDPFVRRIREAPYLSGYHLAEWLVWNWWRLRWESRSSKTDWGFSHRLATIGAGYVWPNLTFFSDGERVSVVSKPSHDQGDGGYRYIADAAVALPAGDFENAIDRFVEQIIGQINAEGLGGNNLALLHTDLLNERRTPNLARFRKIEALLGYDPDEAPVDEVNRLIEDETALGLDAVTELAAESSGQGAVVGAREIIALAKEFGVDSSMRDAFHLRRQERVAWSQTPAWLVGQRLARATRAELGLSEQPIDNHRLTDLVAVDTNVLTDPGGAPLSFALMTEADHNRIVLRSSWRTGRRFELARLLGDRLVMPDHSRLSPVTRSQTYRQKLQRAFAAELLSPFDAVETMLNGDYSDEQQQDIAVHFDVSPLTIRTLLVNHRRIDRYASEAEFDSPIKI